MCLITSIDFKCYSVSKSTTEQVSVHMIHFIQFINLIACCKKVAHCSARSYFHYTDVVKDHNNNSHYNVVSLYS